jgi:ketosteroid isomerase-like protein
MPTLAARLHAACAVMLAMFVIGPTAAPAAAQSSAEDAVRQTEDRRIKALIDDDFATLEAIFADDLTYTHSNALVDSKASYMAALRSGKTKYEAVDRQPAVVRLYGDTAIMTGEASVALRGQPTPIVLRYTLVYVRQQDRWRMTAWQSTRLPQAK